MAGQKKRTSRISGGERQKSNIAHEKKRQEKFAAKRGTDKEYKYTPNPYDKKTQYEQWHDEDMIRREKAKSSKLPYAQKKSIFSKLDNEIKLAELRAKANKKKR